MSQKLTSSSTVVDALLTELRKGLRIMSVHTAANEKELKKAVIARLLDCKHLQLQSNFIPMQGLAYGESSRSAELWCISKQKCCKSFSAADKHKATSNEHRLVGW